MSKSFFKYKIIQEENHFPLQIGRKCKLLVLHLVLNLEFHSINSPVLNVYAVVNPQCNEV